MEALLKPVDSASALQIEAPPVILAGTQFQGKVTTNWQKPLLPFDLEFKMQLVSQEHVLVVKNKLSKH